MDIEFTDSLITRIRSAVPPSVKVSENILPASSSGDHCVYSVGYSPSGDSNGNIQTVTVDVDIWASGPNSVAATDIANMIETFLFEWSVITVRQGRVRLTTLSRTNINEGSEQYARVTLRFTGKCFRRVS